MPADDTHSYISDNSRPTINLNPDFDDMRDE